MNRLRLVILLIFAFSIKLGAQNVVHLCIGDNHNFGVPDDPTSLVFNWSVSDPSLATINSGNGSHHIVIDLKNKGVFRLLVEEIGANGCIGYDSISVQIHELPNPIITSIDSTSFCEGDSVRLELDSLYTSILWNTGSTNHFVYADILGGYFATVTDTNGCKNISNTINTDVHAKPVADFIVDGICANNPSKIVNISTISEGDIISSIWHLEDGDVRNGDSILFTHTFSGNYYTELFVTSDYGCVDSIGKLYYIYNNPIASFEYSPFTISTLQPEMNFINTTPNTTSVFWDFDDSTYSVMLNPLHEFRAAGIYDVMLTVEDDNLCIDSIMHSITMYYDFVLYVPTAFSPNNDGDNDTFGPKGLRMDKYKSYDFRVYNKWGEEIFETTDINESWDGTDAPDDVYNWVLIITDELGRVREKSGIVTLLK